MKKRNIIAVFSALVALALLPMAQAAPAPNTPDPGSKPVSNTADGQNALLSITSGTHNAAFGFDALLSNSDANFNTAVGSVASCSTTEPKIRPLVRGRFYSTQLLGITMPSALSRSLTTTLMPPGQQLSTMLMVVTRSSAM